MALGELQGRIEPGTPTDADGNPIFEITLGDWFQFGIADAHNWDAPTIESVETAVATAGAIIDDIAPAAPFDVAKAAAMRLAWWLHSTRSQVTEEGAVLPRDAVAVSGAAALVARYSKPGAAVVRREA